jgi:superfamily II DNA or RNA helicase
MVKLYLSEQYPDYAAIYTTSKSFYDWLKISPSRLWKSGDFYYPVDEILDLVEYCEMVKLELQVDDALMEAYRATVAKRELLDKYKSVNDLSDEEFNKFSDAPLFKGKLYSYQKPIVVQMLLMKRYLLSLETGLGKTPLSLYAACLLKRIKPDLKVLIVCESNQLHKPWLETIYKLTSIKDIVILQGSKDERLSTLYDPDSKKGWIWITTYDSIKLDGERMPQKWDIIVMDEVTKVKNMSTLASKALRVFDSTYMWALSATPIMNTFTDLYGIFKLLHPKLFTNVANFINRYLIVDFFGRPKKVNKLTAQELKRKIAPWFVQKTKVELGMQKPVHIETYSVPLTTEQEAALREVQIELDNGSKTAFDVQTKLRQICNSAKLIEDYATIDFDKSTNKLKVLNNIIVDTVDTKKKSLIVFSFFIPIVDWLSEYYGKNYSVGVINGSSKKTCKNNKELYCSKCKYNKSCTSLKKIVEDFNTGKTEILFGTDSMQRSHDFRACDTIVNFDLPWSSGELTQRIGRIERATNPAKEYFIKNIISTGTKEESIMHIIESKEKETNQIFPRYSVSFSKMSKEIQVKTYDDLS